MCDTAYGLIGVEWDKKIGIGHNCDGHCKSGHGYYVLEGAIELVAESDIDEDSFLNIVS